MELESTLDEPAEPGLPRGPKPLATWPRIAGYRIEGAIGAGATGTVYRAIQEAVDRPVAVKVLHAEHSGNARIVRRLVREARTLARLKHPGIVGAIDMGQSEGRWWFAMELVEGQSLSERLRSGGPLSEREALRLFLPLAEAVEHLAEHGVVHRDIKPANILLEGGDNRGSRLGRPRLADLGLAFAEADPGITGEGSLLGTPHYVSPEQARDPTDVGTPSDLWALGATMFHAVCGRPPFVGPSVAEVLAAVLHARVPDPRSLAPELSPGFVLVLRKCLTRSTDQRYRTARELIADLELLRERRAPRVRRAELDPLAASPRPAWRSPRLILLVAGSLALGALLAGVYLERSEPEPSQAAPAARQATFAPLEPLLARARSAPAELGPALSELEALRSAVPSEAGQSWWEAREELGALLRDALARLRQELQIRFDSTLASGDLRAAAAQLATGPDERLRALTGMERAALPEAREAELAGWWAELERRLDQAGERARSGAQASLLRRFEDLIEPEAQSLWDSGRWDSALLRLELEPQQWLREAGLDPDRWPEALQAAAVQDVESRARRLWNARFALWLEAQEQLLAAVERAPREALSSLDLDSAFEERLTDLEARLEAAQAAAGIAPLELPRQGRRRLEQARQAARSELAAGFAAGVLMRARDALALRVDCLAPAWLAVRRPLMAGAELRDLERRLLARERDLSRAEAEAVGAPDLSAERRELAEMRLILSAALAELEGTESLLAAAEEGLRASLGQRGLWVVPFGAGGVPLEGTLAAGADPRLDGFQLRVDTGQVYPLSFERLDAEDLVRLARASRGATRVEIELSAGLLFLREGRRSAAAEALSGAGSSTSPLRARLSERLLAGAPWADPGAERALLWLGDASGPEALERRDRQGARALLRLLLERYSGDARVGLQRPALEARLAALGE
jgi:serine/threonine-protein kinase